MKKISVVILFSILFGIINAQEIDQQKKYYNLVDFAECNIKVEKYSFPEIVKLQDGTYIKPSRMDAKLIELKLSGVAPEIGRISLNPFLFGINCMFRDHLKFLSAKAIGVKGKNPDTDEVIEIWYWKKEDSFNYFVESVGIKFEFYLLVEIPKEIDEFYLRIPSVHNELIKL